MLDVVDCMRRYNAGRDPERLALKYAKMSASPFVFLRGRAGRCRLARVCASRDGAFAL